MTNRPNRNRRRVLQALACAAMTPAARAAMTGAAGSAFDPRSPADNLRALVKLQGSLDGRPGVTYTTGQLIRIRHGALAEVLVDFARCQVRAFQALPDGRYACAKHNWMMCRDPRTGEFVTEFRAPSGALERAPGFVVRNTPMIYGADGLRWTKIRTEPSLVASPLRMAWETIGEEGTATLAHTLRTANPAGKLSVETASTTMGFRWPALLGDSPSTDCVVSDLLQVDEAPDPRRTAPSQLLYVGTGRRLPDVEALPDAFARESERRYPGILADAPDPRSAASPAPTASGH